MAHPSARAERPASRRSVEREYSVHSDTQRSTRRQKAAASFPTRAAGRRVELASMLPARVGLVAAAARGASAASLGAFPTSPGAPEAARCRQAPASALPAAAETWRGGRELLQSATPASVMADAQWAASTSQS